MVDGIQLRIGFRSKNQLPFFMIWKELWKDDEVIHAWVVYQISYFTISVPRKSSEIV